MALTPMSASVDNISQLGDNPNTDNNLSAAALKAVFDKAALDIKAYINTSLIPEIEDALANYIAQTANIADGSVVSDKLGSNILPAKVGIKHGTETPTTSTISNGQIYLKHS